MSNEYVPGRYLRVTAGTALKIGFFGALGALLFSLIVWTVLAVIVLVLAAAGVTFGGLTGLFGF